MKKDPLIFLIVDVNTYDGAKKAERPIRFRLYDKTYTVVEILDRWYEGSPVAGRPNYTYFKVLTLEGGIQILRYNQRYDVWSVLISP